MVFFAVFSSIILQGCKTQETPLSLINVDFSLEYPVMDLKIYFWLKESEKSCFYFERGFIDKEEHEDDSSNVQR